MTAFSDIELERRGNETLIASWEAYARGAEGAALIRTPGVALGLFPREPERSIYNNALLTRGLAAGELNPTLDAMEAAYASAGVTRFAAWVHETDEPMRAALEGRGYTFDSSTRAMGMALADLHGPRPELEPGESNWTRYLERFGLPPGLIARADHAAFNLLFARWEGEDVAVALAFDHAGDCGIYNVETLEYARRRGFGSKLTALQLHRARDRGCVTASLQSTPMAERVYASAGFRDLGRILEYVPGN